MVRERYWADRKRLPDPGVQEGFGSRRRPTLWRRPMLWRRPIWRRGRWSRWLWSGPFILLLLGATSYKLHGDDVHRLETATGKSDSALVEDELVAEMGRLGIQNRGLSEEDRRNVAEAF